MAGINRHPAPGLGELQPGWFVVPQNPMQGPVSYIRGIGDILSTDGFTVPQNPVAGYNAGHVLPIGVQPGQRGTINNKPVGVGGLGGLGCGCGGGGASPCGCSGGLSGIGDDFTKLTTDLSNGNIMDALVNDTLLGVPVWAYGVLAAVFLFAGGEGHSYASRGRRAGRAARSAF